MIKSRKEIKKMKTFDYAKNRNKKSFKMPTIKVGKHNFYIWGLPFVPWVIACDWYYNKMQWSEEKATKVLNYFLPHVLEFDEKENAYYYCTVWHFTGYNLSKRVPFGMKKWAKKFSYETFRFLETNYENEEFSKTIEKDCFDATWIKFKKKEK